MDSGTLLTVQREPCDWFHEDIVTRLQGAHTGRKTAECSANDGTGKEEGQRNAGRLFSFKTGLFAGELTVTVL